MKSRVHLKHKTKYRVGNWPEYERALVSGCSPPSAEIAPFRVWDEVTFAC